MGALAVHQADAFSRIPGLIQGFTVRTGGCSKLPYSSLNLGAHVGDDAENVRANRELLWASLGVKNEQVTMAKQVHGTDVGVASRDRPQPAVADALITNEPGHLLVQFFADCAPVYVADPETGALALIHAGWRGAAKGVVAKSLSSMISAYGPLSESAVAAVGPCIGADYEVGAEVADALMAASRPAAERALIRKTGRPARWSLDLRSLLAAQLIEFGLRRDSISMSTADTFADSGSFFSFRRDGASTGRMAGYIGWLAD